MAEETETTTEKAAAKKPAAKKAAATKKAAAKKAVAKTAAPKAAAKRTAEGRGVEGAGGGEAALPKSEDSQAASAEARSSRKTREGIVASTRMDKTAVVLITTRKPHPLYRKTMVRTSRLNAHDENNDLRVGDRVRVAETRPLSKTKRWRLVEILERAK